MLTPPGTGVDAARHDALARRIRGTVTVPGAVDYDAARRIWNARFDHRPAAIVRVAGPDDVAAALDHARTHGLPFTVRAGGHSPAGWSSIEDGLVIDLRALDDIAIGADGLVGVGGGVIVADLVRRLGEAGLAIPVGTCSEVGIGGLTLSGGLGHLNGHLGLTCDALRWAEMVLADGRRIVASAEAEPDLFWAVRGAGANFGVVTRLGFEAVPMAAGFGGMAAYRGLTAAKAIRTFRDCCLSAGDRLGLELRLFAHGTETIAIVSAFWVGDADEGSAALATLAPLGPPDAGGFEVMDYARFATLDAGPSAPRATYQKSANLSRLDEDAIHGITSAYDVRKPGGLMTLIHYRHGATARVAVAATAYPHRTPAFEVTFAAAWTPGQAAEDIAAVDAAWTAIGGDTHPVYVGMLDAEPPERCASAYGSNHPRLARLKALYDPWNSFRNNANIVPDEAEFGGVRAVIPTQPASARSGISSTRSR